MPKLIVIWFLSLAVVALCAPSVLAQFGRAVTPRVMSGDDIGFRVQGLDGNGKPSGVWVVRVNGEWVEVSTAPQRSPLTHQ